MQQTTTLKVAVYRRLDNRLAGQSDDSPLAWDLHRNRRRALEDAFAAGSGFDVIDWDVARDEERTHELAELTVVAGLAVKYVIVPGAKLLAEKLIDAGVDAAIAEVAKAIFSKLRPKQDAKEILDFRVTLPDGTVIDAQPPDRGSTVTITTAGGTVEISHQAQTT